MTNYKLVNLDYLNELAEGDKDFIVDMVQTFLDNVPSYIHEFRSLKQNANWDGMEKFAHKSKATFLFMGLNELSSDSAEIERMCKSKSDAKNIESLLNKMEPQFISVVRELQLVLNDYSSIN